MGSVELGAAADLLLLDDDPLRDVRSGSRVRGVIINGRYLDRSRLDALLASH